jgi:hypothetical protein
MTVLGPLKLALKRGALVTAANWPVVVAQFIADTLFKTLLAVPIAGGVVLVVLLVGGDPVDFFRLPLSAVVPRMVAVLVAQPVALAAFLAALGLVVMGGSVMMFAMKAGTVTVLLAGERAAGAIELPPLRLSALQQANRASVDLFIGGVRGLFGRYLRLGIGLSVVYLALAGGFLAVVVGVPPTEALDARLVAVMASLALVAAVTLVNFLYLLLQIVVAADECAVHQAVPAVARLLRRRTGLLLRALAAILALMALSTAASILATAALGLIAFVPFVGLAALPLQVCAWLMRGVVFQYVGLTGLSTYAHLHATLQPAGLEAEAAFSSARTT